MSDWLDLGRGRTFPRDLYRKRNALFLTWLAAGAAPFLLLIVFGFVPVPVMLAIADLLNELVWKPFRQVSFEGCGERCWARAYMLATRRWTEELAGTKAKVRDTRKTLPGLRALQKYAVRCGGGVNHRMSLGDAALVKDNHVVAAGGVAEAFARVKKANPSIPVEVEVDTLEQLDAALQAGADLVLLDNMSPATMREAVAIAGRHRASTGRAVILEASGGLSIEVAREVAATGVDYLSVGGLTHSVTVLDIGLDLEDLKRR